MRVLVTGAAGLLGFDVINELLRAGHTCLGCDLSQPYPGLSDQLMNNAYRYLQLDVRDEKGMKQIFSVFLPEVVVHCAAIKDVVWAEKEENRETVYQINVKATRFIAELCASYHCKMVYISTDYVFDGSSSEPWDPDFSQAAPLNYYGQTKLEGEHAVAGCLDHFFVIRTQWIFGNHGNDFVKKILHAGKVNDSVSVVDDEFGTPTYAKDLAILIVEMLESEKYGCYHATNSGTYVSRYEFAREIFLLAKNNVRLVSVSSADYASGTVVRPKNCRLNLSKLLTCGFRPLPDWHDALSAYLNGFLGEKE